MPIWAWKGPVCRGHATGQPVQLVDRVRGGHMASGLGQSPLCLSSWSCSSGRGLNLSANGLTHLLLPFRGIVLGFLSAKWRKQWTKARGTGPEHRRKVPKTKVAEELLTLEAKDVALTLRALHQSAVPPVNGMITLGGQTLCSWKKIHFCCCSVAQSFPTLCDPMDCSMSAAATVLRHLPELAQTHVH